MNAPLVEPPHPTAAPAVFAPTAFAPAPVEAPAPAPALAATPVLAANAAPAQAPATSTSTSAPTSPPALTLADGPGLASLALPAVALLALAAAALVLSRRRRAVPRLLTVLESQPLGPKRQLILARLGDDLYVLGASEAGIALLDKRLYGETSAAAAALAPAAPAATTPAPLAGLVAKLRAVRPGGRPPQFDALLAESAEDQELRRKLARGQRGSIT